MGAGIGALGVVSSILTFLVQSSFVVFIVSLLIGIFIEVKNRIFTKEDFEQLKESLSLKKNVQKETCASCGKEPTTI